uniref:Uncharacterized protein n=1 Tax=Parastrongyloides trichosuri TaxID=131310 RepID=A0A0N4ZNP5_PARTI
MILNKVTSFAIFFIIFGLLCQDLFGLKCDVFDFNDKGLSLFETIDCAPEKNYCFVDNINYENDDYSMVNSGCTSICDTTSTFCDPNNGTKIGDGCCCSTDRCNKLKTAS